MTNEIQPFENQRSYSFASEKIRYLHSLGGEREEKEGNVRRGGEEAAKKVWIYPDESSAEDGLMSRGLLPVLTQTQGRQDEAGRCGGSTAFPGQQESESYAERCDSAPPNE